MAMSIELRGVFPGAVNGIVREASAGMVYIGLPVSGEMPAALSANREGYQANKAPSMKSI